MEVTVEFSGGLEDLITERKKRMQLIFGERSSIPICGLIAHIMERVVIRKPELFAQMVSSSSNCQGDTIPTATVRPGILVLVNNCDWEVEGRENYVVHDGDTIGFVSTLHGG